MNWSQVNLYQKNRNRILLMIENDKNLLVDLLVQKELTQVLRLSNEDFIQVLQSEAIIPSTDKNKDLKAFSMVRSSLWHNLLMNPTKAATVLLSMLDFLIKENNSTTFVLSEVKH